MTRLTASIVCLVPLAMSCGKVPIFNVNANFAVADATWFEAEQTLFVFSEVQAEQGLGDPSVIEIRYTTDDERVPWTPLEDFPRVHTHLNVDCGVNALCGSTSVFVPLEPRNVQIRLRYHREGALALLANTVFNVVDAGPAHSNRSFLVYGVFDELNELIQWRGRHLFPTLRNQKAEDLGLRRQFTVDDQGFGSDVLVSNDNPYGYGATCPDTDVALGFDPVATTDRAIFGPEVMPIGASTSTRVCAESTVTDALGTFVTGAVAQKNPEVRPAFPLMRSPVREATPLRFFLGPCNRTIAPKHETMQRQRLELGELPTTCTDAWQQPNFAAGLVNDFRDAVEAARPAGNDMVLVIALHQDEPGLSEVVEEALAQVVPSERHRSSPRLAGAFVLDSTIRGLTLPELEPVTLWCPSTEAGSDASSRSCAIAPDNPSLDLGPFSFGGLPILPSQEQYLDFIDIYSDAQAGSVTDLSFRAPEFATTADHFDLGSFGVITFLNNEGISADPEDAFSYCIDGDPQLFVYRSQILDSTIFSCIDLGLPEELCGAAEVGVLPLEYLSEWHEVFGETEYELGVFWEFPFLLRMQYEVVGAGNVSAFGLSVPFGIAQDAESYYGTELWTQEEFPLDEVLTQCTRFCDHPTFDSAGVYHVTDPFRRTYTSTCYLPDFPQEGDSGFPLDP